MSAPRDTDFPHGGIVVGGVEKYPALVWLRDAAEINSTKEAATQFYTKVRAVLDEQAAEIERLNAEAWGAAAEASAMREMWVADLYTLHGYEVFVGPCVHGRYPWDRCDECGEETAVHALLKVRAAHLAEIERLKGELEHVQGVAQSRLAHERLLQSRLEEAHREASALLQRAEQAEARLKHASARAEVAEGQLASTAAGLDALKESES